MLLEEFLRPLGISQSTFAIQLGVSFPRLNEVINAKRAVTPDTALRGCRDGTPLLQHGLHCCGVLPYSIRT